MRQFKGNFKCFIHPKMTERQSALLCYPEGLFFVLNRCSKYNSRTLSGASLPQTASQNNSFYYNSAICNLFLFFYYYCVFFPSMSLCFVLSSSLFWGLLPPLFLFLSWSLPVCCFLFSPFFAFQLCWYENAKKKKPQATLRTESRTRDRNGTLDFGSTNVLSGNRCWKNRKKTHIFVIRRKKHIRFFCLVSPKSHKNISLDPKCT